MKRLEELGISNAPLKYVGYQNHSNGKYIHLGEVRTSDGKHLVSGMSQPDAMIFAAAPDMYDAIWDILFKGTKITNCRNCKGHELGNCKTCPLGKARAALAKASGEDFQ